MTDPVSELLDIAAASEARSLNQLANLAVRSVAGCAAANVVRWNRAVPGLATSTHPDLAALVDVQVEAGRGPAWDSVSTGEATVSPDLMAESRWPEFAAAALRLGVRCCITLAYRERTDAVSLSLFGARPRALDPRRAQPAELLASLGGAVLGAVSRYGDARRTASQLQDGAAARAVVDQAKGILMHALGCTAEDAMGRMRQASQLRNVRTTDVARDIIEARGRIKGFASDQ